MKGDTNLKIKKHKKILAIILVLVTLIVSVSVGFVAFAGDDINVDSNKLMFESILQNRRWIIDTLVSGKRTNNPYLVCSGATEESLIDDVLSSYENDKSVKILVDCLEGSGNLSQDITALAPELYLKLLNLLGVVSDDDLNSALAEYAKSAANLKYEDIINAVLTEDYTSSWGTTLFEQDAEIEQIRQLNEILKKIGKYQKALKSQSSFLSDGYFESEEDMEDYVDNFLDAYTDDLYALLTNTTDCQWIKDNPNLNKKLVGLSTNAFSIAASAFDPLRYKDESGLSDDLNEAYSFFLAPEVDAILKGSSKVVKYTSVATEYAQVINALYSQVDTTAKAMKRLQENTVDEDLRNSLSIYAGYVRDQGNDMLLATDAIIDYVTKQSSIGDKVLSSGQKVFTGFLENKFGYYNALMGSMQSAVSEDLISLGKCVKIALWVADKATNIKEVAKKIYVCKYIQKVIDDATYTYSADFLSYKSNPTDLNAKKCLDDLEFIKKIRLYGEKQAYGCVCQETGSLLGSLLGSDSVQGGIDQRYQGCLDLLLGCNLSQTSDYDFTLSSGEELTVIPYNYSEDNYTLMGLYKKADGSKIYFPEADIILNSNVTVNNATVKISGLDSLATPIICMPSLTVNGNSKIILKSSKLYFAQLTNSGTLDLSLSDNNSEFQIVSGLTNSGKFNVSGLSDNVNIQDIENSGTITVNNYKINAYGNVNNTGTIDSKLNLCGDGTTLNNLRYFSSSNQTLSGGEGKISSLYLNQCDVDKLRINDSQYVTNYITSGSKKMNNTSNLYLTGNCTVENNTFNNAISMKNYSSPSKLTIKGRASIYSAVTLNYDTIFKNNLLITSNCTSLKLNAPCYAKGDVQYSGGTIEGTNKLMLYGDLNVAASNANISNLDFCSSLPQTVSGTLTVATVSNNNKSFSGVTVNDKVYVTKLYNVPSSPRHNTNNSFTLTGNATVSSSFNDSINIENWTCSQNINIDGLVKASGTINIADGKTLKVATYSQSGGTLNIGKASTLASDSSFANAGVTNNNGTLSVNGDCSISGTFSGGTVNTSGDISASASFTPATLKFESKLSQKLNNSDKTSIDNLTVNNKSDDGFTAGSVIEVNKSYSNNAKRIVNPQNIVLKYISQVDREDKGSVTIGDTLTVKEGKTYTVWGDMTVNSGAKVIVENGAKLIVNGTLVCNGTLDISGTMTVKGDASFNSSTVNADGLIVLKGDVSVTNGTWNKPNISISGSLNQTISGSTIDVGELYVINKSNSVSVNNEINVYTLFERDCKNIKNEANIHIMYEASSSNASQTIKTSLTVKEGKIYTINGNLTLNSSSTLTVEKGAELIVKGTLVSNSAVITVDGDMVVRDDAYINSSTVNASGLITFKGDVNNSSSTFNKPNLSFDSKLPQTIGGSAINADNLNVNNSSKGGITFNCTVNYYSKLNTNSSNINNESNLKSA